MSIDVTYHDTLGWEKAIYIDVRSPKEFAEDHIPQSINIPILDDDQRQIVGTLYKQQGKEVATLRGIELVLPSLEKKIRQFHLLSHQGPLVLYCWRGGLRSKSMADILSATDMEVYRLIGGYKAYRKSLIEDLDKMPLPPFYSLYGLTGTGKTKIIQALESRGVQILDLEAYANHRGSVFGSVGLGEQPSQKRFETILYSKLRALDLHKPVVVEGESSRIGRIIIPQRIFAHLLSSKRILIYDEITNRAHRIVEEYSGKNTQEELIESVGFLTRRLGANHVKRLIGAIQEKRYLSVVEELLVKYYDPLYHHPNSPSSDYEASICSNSIDQAADTIQILLNKGE